MDVVWMTRLRLNKSMLFLTKAARMIDDWDILATQCIHDPIFLKPSGYCLVKSMNAHYDRQTADLKSAAALARCQES